MDMYHELPKVTIPQKQWPSKSTVKNVLPLINSKSECSKPLECSKSIPRLFSLPKNCETQVQISIFILISNQLSG